MQVHDEVPLRFSGLAKTLRRHRWGGARGPRL
jgi:hypothetical protein